LYAPIATTERQRDRRRDREAADDAPDGHRDVLREAHLGHQGPARSHHRDRIGEERLRDHAAQGRGTPQEHEDHEKREAEDHSGGSVDRL
jgi:hypothetical protein